LAAKTDTFWREHNPFAELSKGCLSIGLFCLSLFRKRGQNDSIPSAETPVCCKNAVPAIWWRGDLYDLNANSLNRCLDGFEFSDSTSAVRLIIMI
jgi:hypothetical protein